MEPGTGAGGARDIDRDKDSEKGTEDDDCVNGEPNLLGEIGDEDDGGNRTAVPDPEVGTT